MPLAVYREVATHLRQIEGVKTELIPQGTEEKQFDYHRSQLSGIWIEYSEDLDADCQKRLAEILDYYGRHHGSWEQELID